MIFATAYDGYAVRAFEMNADRLSRQAVLRGSIRRGAAPRRAVVRTRRAERLGARPSRPRRPPRSAARAGRDAGWCRSRSPTSSGSRPKATTCASFAGGRSYLRRPDAEGARGAGSTPRSSSASTDPRSSSRPTSARSRPRAAAATRCCSQRRHDGHRLPVPRAGAPAVDDLSNRDKNPGMTYPGGLLMLVAVLAQHPALRMRRRSRRASTGP